MEKESGSRAFSAMSNVVVVTELFHHAKLPSDPAQNPSEPAIAGAQITANRYNRGSCNATRSHKRGSETKWLTYRESD